MRRSPLSSIVLAAAFMLVPIGSVLADSPDAGLSVEPSEVTAGQSVLLAGNDLEPNDERVIVLSGEDIVVNLGTATTDADGMLSHEITIPAHVPSGTYQLQAIGDETLQVELQVTAAEGSVVGPPPATGPIKNRERTPFELGLIVALAALIAVLGSLLAWRAERFRGSSAA
jgi:hypothetical protein